MNWTNTIFVACVIASLSACLWMVPSVEMRMRIIPINRWLVETGMLALIFKAAAKAAALGALFDDSSVLEIRTLLTVDAAADAMVWVWVVGFHRIRFSKNERGRRRQ